MIFQNMLVKSVIYLSNKNWYHKLTSCLITFSKLSRTFWNYKLLLNDEYLPLLSSDSSLGVGLIILCFRDISLSLSCESKIFNYYALWFIKILLFWTILAVKMIRLSYLRRNIMCYVRFLKVYIKRCYNNFSPSKVAYKFLRNRSVIAWNNYQICLKSRHK